MKDEDKYLLNRDQVAKRFGITKRFLEACAARGDGPRYVRLGRLVRYRVCDIETWIEANTHRAPTQ